MKLQIIKTTDGKNIGRTFEVPYIDYSICKSFGIHPVSIIWHGDICTLQNSHYTAQLQKLKELENA